MSASSIAATANLKQDSQQHTLLHGPLLTTARLAWVTIFVLTWFVFLGNLASVATHVNALMGELSFEVARAYTFFLDVFVMVVCSGVAGAIFRRKSNDWLALFVSLTLVTFGAANTTAIQMYGMMPEGENWLPLLVTSLGLGSILIFLYIFPDGKFTPQWTRIPAIFWIVWVLTWPFVPVLSPIGGQWSVAMTFGAFSVAYMTGAFAQLYRRRHLRDPLERQQTKWATFGLLLGLTGFFVAKLLHYAIVPLLSPDSSMIPILLPAIPILNACSILAIPVTIGISMMRFRLWDIDPLIHRTLVYGLVTVGLGVLLAIEIVVFQTFFRHIIGRESDLAIILSTIIITVIYQPTRRKMQNMIDRRFYREKVDFHRTFTDFSSQIRTIIDLSELSNLLVNRVTTLLHITYGALFLEQKDGAFMLDDHHKLADLCTHMEAPDLEKAAMFERLPIKSDVLTRLQAGNTVVQPKDIPFALLVPLRAPRAGGTELVGVLAYGPRRSGQAYSSDDQTLLGGLADQAGTAIYVARLIMKGQLEAQRRQEAERALEAHRQSPIGRAEAFATSLVAQPTKVLAELHGLTQKAGQDADASNLVNNLNKVLDKPEVQPIAHLADGYNYLFNGITVPELLSFGLRTLITQLELPPTKDWTGAAQSLALYRLCQEAINVRSVSQITQLLPNFHQELQVCCVMVAATNGNGSKNTPPAQEMKLDVPAFLTDLAQSLIDLRGVAETLHAYERVDTSQDKLAYLVSAVERLSRVDRNARADLGGADRPVILRIAEVWLGVVTGAMSDIQTRAQIVCTLLTHHTWQDDVISLALSVRNNGRGAALNIRVNLAPAPEYTAVDPAVRIERLAPDEETQVELRVRPRLAPGMDQFRARFMVQYADPRGSDQIENFADVVYLLKGNAAFEFIPNPYVIGTPLQGGSPLFFGREDVVAFIQENLAAAHRNNLVLIGQRRTGKTSLLKQLAVKLGKDYLPVYLDGQALSLDPGLANFFLSLATEISFAIDDQGLTPPLMPDFTNSPATTFERVFLADARKVIGDRHLLVLFDEFEELESAVKRGNLDASIFGFLRHLIQHGEKISVIFCGTHRMEELASDYWSVLFNISLYRHIGFLEQNEAMRLIQEPVAKYGMRYDDLALDKIWRVTAGHPYFLQLLCHSLVNRHNRTKRNYITVADVNAALDDILASGEAHFVYLWAESSPEERLVLTALSRIMVLTGRITPVQVLDYLEERGIHIQRRAVSEALHRLTLSDILSKSAETDPTIGETYRWHMGLLGLWVEKYRSLSRVADEVKV